MTFVLFGIIIVILILSQESVDSRMPVSLLIQDPEVSYPLPLAHSFLFVMLMIAADRIFLLKDQARGKQEVTVLQENEKRDLQQKAENVPPQVISAGRI